LDAEVTLPAVVQYALEIANTRKLVLLIHELLRISTLYSQMLAEMCVSTLPYLLKPSPWTSWSRICIIHCIIIMNTQCCISN